MNCLNGQQNILKSTTYQNPRLDAEVLLGHIIEKSRLQLYLHFDMPVYQEHLSVYRELIKRRIALTPISYLINRKEFMSLDFYVDERVLIPRPETEFIVETILNTNPDKPQRILEIGTGSGVIATTLAVNEPEWEIIATDICQDALDVAKKNRDTHECTDRISLLHGDLFDPIQNLDTSHFNWIVSNPPYVMSCENNDLSPDVKEHDHILLYLQVKMGCQLSDDSFLKHRPT